jgi:hypothetical protein
MSNAGLVEPSSGKKDRIISIARIVMSLLLTRNKKEWKKA